MQGVEALTSDGAGNQCRPAEFVQTGSDVEGVEIVRVSCGSVRGGLCLCRNVQCAADRINYWRSQNSDLSKLGHGAAPLSGDRHGRSVGRGIKKVRLPELYTGIGIDRVHAVMLRGD